VKNIHILTLLVLIITSCSLPNQQPKTSTETQPVLEKQTLQISKCDLKPITIPTLPAVIPEYGQLDKATGLHVTGTAQVIDLASYRLKVTGLVEQPLSLQYDQLRCLPKVTAKPELKCSGIVVGFVDTANWSGVPIAEVLKLARPLPQAKTMTLVAADGYKLDIDLETAMKPENFLAYELEGKPVPVLHGFPLRAVFPGRPGSIWVKWLVELKIS
jgi:DMSO/TMAO reductase YedYZ molybdopterin-dependent catalytic subunit